MTYEWAIFLHGDFGTYRKAHLLTCPDERAARARLDVWRGWRGDDVCSVLLCRLGEAEWAEVS
jgi:hypothetical protein